jgi:hypothetical protein
MIPKRWWAAAISKKKCPVFPVLPTPYLLPKLSHEALMTFTSTYLPPTVPALVSVALLPTVFAAPEVVRLPATTLA